MRPFIETRRFVPAVVYLALIARRWMLLTGTRSCSPPPAQAEAIPRMMIAVPRRHVQSSVRPTGAVAALLTAKPDRDVVIRRMGDSEPAVVGDRHRQVCFSPEVRSRMCSIDPDDDRPSRIGSWYRQVFVVIADAFRLRTEHPHRPRRRVRVERLCHA
jgi:hypothetical protein